LLPYPQTIPKDLYYQYTLRLFVDQPFRHEIGSNEPTHRFHLGRVGQRSEAEVGLNSAQVGEELGGLLALDAGVNNHIVARNPVDGGGDLILVASLERVDNAKDLSAVSASRGRVREDGTDDFLRVDDKDRADGKGDALLINVGCILIVNPIKQVSVILRPCIEITLQFTCRRDRQSCAPCQRRWGTELGSR